MELYPTYCYAIIVYIEWINNKIYVNIYQCILLFEILGLDTYLCGEHPEFCGTSFIFGVNIHVIYHNP